jgi:pyocin large subunit-like protein
VPHGFRSSAHLSDHFKRHGAEFGISTEAEYAKAAASFLCRPKRATTIERQRSKGDVVRFDPSTDEFGIVAADGTIRTYYKLIAGITHPEPTNMDYFNAACLKH